MKKFALLLAFSFLLLPALSFAQTAAAPAANTGPSIVPNTLQEGPYKLVCLIRDVTNWMFTGFLVVAVIFILIAAYYYLIAEGGAEEVLKTHRMLIYSAVGIAVAILSRGFVTVVQSVTGVPIQETCASGGPQQGASGGQGGSSGAPAGSTTPPAANNWAPLAFQRTDDKTQPFDAEVQKCSDGLTPGVVVTYDDGGPWRNFPTVGGDETGNPNIPSGTQESAQAGEFAIVGTTHTGIQTPFGGLGNGYTFSVETCNDGARSVVMVDKSQNGSWERVD